MGASPAHPHITMGSAFAPLQLPDPRGAQVLGFVLGFFVWFWVFLETEQNT